MDRMGGVTHEGQSVGHIVLGMALAQGEGETARDLCHGTQLTLDGLLQLLPESLIPEGHQAAGLRGILRPDNGTEMLIRAFIQ